MARILSISLTTARRAYEPKKKPKKKPKSVAEMLDESTTSRVGKTRRVGNWDVTPIILTPKKRRRY